MKNSSITNRYSDAIFEIAREDNELDSWKNFLEDLTKVFSESETVDFFQDPKISNKDKLELISNSEIKSNSRQLNFLRLIIEKGNVYLFNSILMRFNKLVDSFSGIKRADVITAFKLNQEELDKINEKLSDLVESKVVSINSVDRTILGGFIAKFDDQMLDMSTKGKLNRLKESIID